MQYIVFFTYSPPGRQIKLILSPSFSFLYVVKQSKNPSKYQQALYQMPKSNKKSRNSPVPAIIPQGSYQCERILDLKLEKGQRHYLIKWKGYDEQDDNTWQPLTNLEYLMQDLLQYQEVHAEQIQKIENHWKKMYQDKKVTHPLQPFNISKMQKKLETWKHQTEEPSQETQEKYQRNGSRKKKNIAKKRTYKKRSLKQQEDEQSYQHQTPPYEVLPKKRGRKPKIIQNKIPQQMASIVEKSPQAPENNYIAQILQSAQNINEFNNEKIHLFETPSKKNQPPQQKGTMSHQRNFKEDQQKLPQNQAFQINQGQKFLSDVIDDKINSSSVVYSQCTVKKMQNSVTQLLSKEINFQKLHEDHQQPIQPKKPESLLKITNNSKYYSDSINLSSNHSPLHNGPMKYIYRKKKLYRTEKYDSESQSQNHQPIKSTFKSTILQVEDQQKESTPISNKEYLKCQIEDANQLKKIQKKQEIRQNQSDYHQNPPENSQNLNQIPNEQSLAEDLPPNPAQEVIDSPQEDNIVVNQPQQINHEDQQEEIQVISPHEQNPSSQNIQKIMSNFIHPKQNQPKNIQFIDLDNSSHHQVVQTKQKDNLRLQQNDSSEQEVENSSKMVEVPKSKKIKKQTKQIKITSQKKQGKGIVGRSQQSLQLTQQGQLFYRPSLNTLFQNMLSTSQLKLLLNPKLLKISSQFKLQNIIFFSVKIVINSQTQMRFMCYQTLRQFFPGQLLGYLQQNGKIQL